MEQVEPVRGAELSPRDMRRPSTRLPRVRFRWSGSGIPKRPVRAAQRYGKDRISPKGYDSWTVSLYSPVDSGLCPGELLTIFIARSGSVFIAVWGGPDDQAHL